MVLLKVLMIVLGVSASAGDFGELRPFTTDGCSLFPDGTPEEPQKWHHCCVRHDVSSWAGGTRDERRQADLELRECVAATGERGVADFMFAGVRMGGTAKLPTPFRWGYGWPKIRKYEALTAEEHEQVQRLKPQSYR